MIQDLEKQLVDEKKSGDIEDLPHEEAELFSNQVSTRTCENIDEGHRFDKLCKETQIAVELRIAFQMVTKLGIHIQEDHECFSEPIRIAINDLLCSVKTIKNNLEVMDKVKQESQDGTDES